MGAGLGHDYAVSAGLSACFCCGRSWGSDDRNAQSARFRPIHEPDLDDPALSRFHIERTGAHHLRCIRADSMGRSYSSRLRPGTDLHLAVGTPQGASTTAQHWIDRRLLHFARHQSLRRSPALEYAKICGFYRAFIFEHYEVSAIASVSSNDAGPGAAFLVGGRRRNAAMAATGSHRRQSAYVLLPLAHTSDTHARHRDMLCALWTGALDVRVAGAAPVSHYAAAGMGILVADCVSDLHCSGSYALPALPLVCGSEAAPQRCMAELFLKHVEPSYSIGSQNPLSGCWSQSFAGRAQNQARSSPANLHQIRNCTLGIKLCGFGKQPAQSL